MSLTFFEFTHSSVSPSTLAPALAEMGEHNTPGKFIHLKPNGESKHYFGHTNNRAMKNLRDALRRRNLPFRELRESQLPERHRKTIVDLRKAGALG
jgi:hypothetical protein